MMMMEIIKRQEKLLISICFLHNARRNLMCGGGLSLWPLNLCTRVAKGRRFCSVNYD